MFGNALTADHMNSLHNRDKFLQKVETPLSHKPKIFLQFFFPFPKYAENFVHFENKGQLHSSNILEVIDFDKGGSLNARKLPVQKNLRESTCSLVPNNDELLVTAISS